MPCTNFKYWALVDCNNFYASCEQVFRPDLRGRPVVVLSNNDGCIVSRSAEAKALGIPMGEPEFRVRGLLRATGTAVFSSNYALYGDMSRRVMDILETLSPKVEQYSIDEAFLRLEGSPAAVSEAAFSLRQHVLRWTGLPVSVGVAATKTLGKLAGHAAKYRGGVFRLPSGGDGLDDFLAAFPAARVWGVGRRLAPKLASRGLRTALDLKRADDNRIRGRFSVSLWRTVLELRGLPCLNDEPAGATRHTIIHSRSFGRKVADKAMLAQAVASFAARAAEKLRKEGLLAGELALRISTARHGEGPYRNEAAHLRLPAPSSDSMVLLQAALRALDHLYAPGYSYARAGILLCSLVRRDRMQGSLLGLERENLEKERAGLMQTVDAINRRYGRSAIRYAAEGPDKADWHMRRENCSPAFTTRWDQLAVARCADGPKRRFE